MVSALCLIAFMKAFGNHLPLPYVFGFVIFLALGVFGVWVFQGNLDFELLALWLRIAWRKPIYDAGKRRTVCPSPRKGDAMMRPRMICFS